MIETLTAPDHVLALRATGRIDEADIATAIELLEAKLAVHDRIAFYVEVEVARMTPGAFARDVRYGLGKLRELRRRIADEQGVPAFMVFSDRTLRGMAQLRPKTRDELLEIHGVGEAKLDAYGDRFLKALR